MYRFDVIRSLTSADSLWSQRKTDQNITANNLRSKATDVVASAKSMLLDTADAVAAPFKSSNLMFA